MRKIPYFVEEAFRRIERGDPLPVDLEEKCLAEGYVVVTAPLNFEDVDDMMQRALDDLDGVTTETDDDLEGIAILSNS